MCTVVLSAYKPGCRTISGIKSVYIIDKATREGTSVAVSVTNGAGTITGTGGTAYKWALLQEDFNFTQARTGSEENKTLSFEQALTGFLHGISAANTYLSEQLGTGRFEAVIEMQNGTALYAGLPERGLTSTDGEGGTTGQGNNDNKGFEVNLSCKSESLAPIVDMAEFNAAFTVTT